MTLDIDTYISSFPDKIQKILKKIRQEIKKSAPNSEEAMAYGIPTFKYYGNLVHFAGFQNHIGFYPTPSAIVAFKKELLPYKHAKGSIQFPINKPLPLKLIADMVKYRVEENTSKHIKTH